MSELIPVRRVGGARVHWFRDREVTGPHKAAAICGSESGPAGWEEFEQPAKPDCVRCLARAKKWGYTVQGNKSHEKAAEACT